ncbi:MAG: CHASE2 domain-containing protein [Candidatus Omnitrophica bacterium]|nr:CHASE2 domain-containing protein [Candidatus Omnitrophota bacterium]
MTKRNILVLAVIGLISFLSFFYSSVLFSSQVLAINDLVTKFVYALNKPQPEFSKDIVVVRIDDYSLQKMDQKWPFRRLAYAKAVEILNRHQAAVVAFDIVFSGKEELKEDDILFSETLALSKSKIVMGSYLRNDDIVLPSQTLVENASLGFVNALNDRDGKVRRIWVHIDREGFSGFSLPIKVVSSFLNDDVKIYDSVRIRDKIIPAKNYSYNFKSFRQDPSNQSSYLVLPVKYSLKEKDFRSISFYDLLQEKMPEDFFKDKIVLVGATAEIVHDIVDTPFGRMPGVFVHANTVLSILKNKYLTTPALPVLLFFLVVVILITGLTVLNSNFIVGTVYSVGFILLVFWGAVVLEVAGWKVPFGQYITASVTFFVLANFYNYIKFFSVLVMIRKQMTIDPITNLFRTRYFYQRAVLERRSLPKKNCYLAVIVLSDFEGRIKGKTGDKVKKIWQKINEILRSVSPLWCRYSRDVILGIRKGKIDVANLYDSLKILSFEEDIKVNIKVGLLDVGPYPNIRDMVPFLIEDLEKKQENVVAFQKNEITVRSKKTHSDNDFISSFYQEAEERTQELLQTKENLIEEERKTKDAYLQVITSLVSALESKDPYTEGHSERVSHYAVLLAERIGMPQEEINKVSKAAILHDIGKIGISDTILQKKDKLTDDEFKIIKEHEILSVKILQPIEEFKEILPYILHHHEGFDGSGYPHGLSGDFIPLGARVITVADIFDALITGRSYKKAYTIEETISILLELKNKKLDPFLVDKFLEIIKERHITSSFVRKP